MAPSGTTTYTYDAKGNVVTKTNAEGTTTYAYDPENRLIQVTKPDGSTISYAYDGDNRRISKTTAQGTINYIYDEDLVTGETDVNGNVFARYVYDDKGTPVSMTRGSQTYNYHYNGHGDVVALTDASGCTAATYKYDVWGNIVDQTGSVENPYLYAGYRYDSEAGLYFLKSRYYDPQVGRFISKDRFAGFDEDPQSQHKYVYCGNDPVNKVDPDGEIALPLVYVAVVGIVVGYFAMRQALKGAVDAYYAKKSQTTAKPKSEPNIKGQGRERIEKKRKSDNWVDQSNKPKDRPIRPKSHTPGKGHRKYKP